MKKDSKNLDVDKNFRDMEARPGNGGGGVLVLAMLSLALVVVISVGTALYTLVRMFLDG